MYPQQYDSHFTKADAMRYAIVGLTAFLEDETD